MLYNNFSSTKAMIYLKCVHLHNHESKDETLKVRSFRLGFKLGSPRSSASKWQPIEGERESNIGERVIHFCRKFFADGRKDGPTEGSFNNFGITLTCIDDEPTPLSSPSDRLTSFPQREKERESARKRERNNSLYNWESVRERTSSSSPFPTSTEYIQPQLAFRQPGAK